MDKIDHAKYNLSTAPSLNGCLVCREKEFETIYHFLRYRIATKSNGYMYISGNPGSGKTATVHRVIKKLQNECKKSNKFQYVEINGLRLTESSRAYCHMLKELTEEIATGKQAQSSLDDIFRNRSSKDVPVILLIDEFDCLYKRSSKVILDILHWRRRSNSQLIVISIANNDGLITLLMNEVDGMNDIITLFFNAYSNEDMEKIVMDRLEGANVFESNALQFLIQTWNTEKGDVRKVLDICRIVLDVVEEDENCNSIITLEDVKAACEKISVDPYILAIRNFSTYQQILLRAIRDETPANGEEQYSLYDRIFSQYKAICDTEGVPCPSIRDVCNFSKNLSNMGFIELDSDVVNIHTKLKLHVKSEFISIALK